MRDWYTGCNRTLILTLLHSYFLLSPSGGLDLIILPGLGFTAEGDRLGRGMGYYDSYQRRCAELSGGKKPDTIALAYTEQICESVPTSEDDVTVDYVLYPDGEHS